MSDIINSKRSDIIDYLKNKSIKEIVNTKGQVLTSDDILQGVTLCNEILSQLMDSFVDYGINVFELLGLRNLSGLLGEIFVSSLSKAVPNQLKKNPHQDGYPDLLSVALKEQIDFYNKCVTTDGDIDRPISKLLFSPYKYGGFEVKATCGNTPPAKISPKPLVGESRVNMLVSFEWKAHHRSTNDLIGLLWDFVEGVPKIISVFFRNDIVEDDWSNVVTPKLGSKSTSISVMKKSAVKKMCDNWIVFINNETYINKLQNNKWIKNKIEG
ncbi:hypothetical protein CI105_05260 [Candidatus Izimaplasma bacterium ZiA1]|uniref:hypothetical protein n=1 Tax=Candidatus Izimoplasma sp. ZiA1 TaxID=2024899 RepID=UPI000BAA5FC7|nr:hypothetical protein CI105_05260 [Candidatus Izimaplasma bacterium ZiA1]